MFGGGVEDNHHYSFQYCSCNIDISKFKCDLTWLDMWTFFFKYSSLKKCLMLSCLKRFENRVRGNHISCIKIFYPTLSISRSMLLAFWLLHDLALYWLHLNTDVPYLLLISLSASCLFHMMNDHTTQPKVRALLQHDYRARYWSGPALD